MSIRRGRRTQVPLSSHVLKGGSKRHAGNVAPFGKETRRTGRLRYTTRAAVKAKATATHATTALLEVILKLGIRPPFEFKKPSLLHTRDREKNLPKTEAKP